MNGTSAYHLPQYVKLKVHNITGEEKSFLNHAGAQFITAQKDISVDSIAARFFLLLPIKSHQDWLSLDLFTLFTSAGPFQCLIISMMNGWIRLRLDIIVHKHHHTQVFESQVVRITVPDPYMNHSKIDWVWVDSHNSHQLDATLSMSHYN